MTTAQLEKAKVRAIEQGVRVYRLGDGRYAIPAGSKPGWAYEVVADEEEALCNCPAGENGRACKHVGAVLALKEAEARMEEARRQEQVMEAFERAYDDLLGDGAYQEEKAKGRV